MKRCDFCDHKSCTDNGEEVCTKRLIYMGDSENFFPCPDFSITIKKETYMGLGIIGIGLLLLIAGLV